MKKITELPTIYIFLAYTILFFTLEYQITLKFGAIAFENDNVNFDLTFNGFLVFNFVITLIGTLFKCLLLSTLTYTIIYIRKINIYFSNIFKVFLIGEFVFLISSFTTFIEYFGKNDYSRADIIQSNHFFELGNLFNWFSDIEIIRNFDILNILYFFIVVVLFSEITNTSNKKIVEIVFWVLVPIFITKQLFYLFLNI